MKRYTRIIVVIISSAYLLFILKIITRFNNSILTNLVLGSAVSRVVSAHLVKSILDITPLLHGTLGFLKKIDYIFDLTC